MSLHYNPTVASSNPIVTPYVLSRYRPHGSSSSCCCLISIWTDGRARVLRLSDADAPPPPQSVLTLCPAPVPESDAMPFGQGHHSQNSQSQQFSPSAGLSQAALALGSIGAPQGNLRSATSGTTNAGTDSLLPGSGNAPGLQSPTTSVSAPPIASMNRQGEELHISTQQSQPPPQQQQQHQQQHQQQPPPPSQQQQQQQHMYNSPSDYSSAPNLNVHQATPQGSYSNSPSVSSVPGSLQVGSNAQQQQQQRPGPSSAFTAPSAVPQINTNAQQYTLPTRSSTMNQQQHPSSHTYSRSSPAGLGPDQKYIPFSNTPESAKYAGGTPAPKYYSSTPLGTASNSPLGLADIRPRANSSMADDPIGGGTMFADNERAPSNSNYFTPWPAYAFDWCKWNVHGGSSAGKMAVGSYLEDTHNFVRRLLVSPHYKH
jgi:WD repeat-containing protein 68